MHIYYSCRLWADTAAATSHELDQMCVYKRLRGLNDSSIMKNSGVFWGFHLIAIIGPVIIRCWFITFDVFHRVDRDILSIGGVSSWACLSGGASETETLSPPKLPLLSCPWAVHLPAGSFSGAAQWLLDRSARALSWLKRSHFSCNSHSSTKYW